MAGTAVIGRDEVLGSIRAFLAAVERGPMALVLSGVAGIGKTILWEEGVAEAGHGFERVLSCRGIEAEAALSFSGLSDLLSDVVADVAALLLPVRRRALEVALLLAEPGDDVPDARAIGVAFLDVLRILAERGPVLVAIDDAQWLDEPSAGAIGLALRRLGMERVGFLATVREGPASRCRSSSSACCPRTVCAEWRSGRWELMRCIVCCGGGWGSSWRGLWSPVSGRRAAVIRSSRWRSGASLRARMSRWTQNGRCPFPTAWADCSASGSSGCPVRRVRSCWWLLWRVGRPRMWSRERLVSASRR
jgi:AAA ATPase domain